MSLPLRAYRTHRGRAMNPLDPSEAELLGVMKANPEWVRVLADNQYQRPNFTER